jgi:hypothetical protein
MVMMDNHLCIRLEKLDNLPASDALLTVLSGAEKPEEVGIGERAIFEPLLKSDTWQELVTWTQERLTAWHSLKVNALEAAWKAEPSAQTDSSIQNSFEKMRTAVLDSLRKGIQENSTLLPDAWFLQTIAQANKPLVFDQATRHLRQEGLELPSDTELIWHLRICLDSFRYLLEEKQGQ